MKTQNTLENKAKFFAQYWGQKVLSDISNSGNKEIYPVDTSNMYGIDRSYLELKPLSQISDEDAIQGIMFTYNKTYDELGEILEVKNYFTFSDITSIELGRNFKTYRQIHHWNGDRKIGSKECDYFRSKGYALPYMDLSVDNLIEYGWIKLKEN
jgi:hypothetical protein